MKISENENTAKPSSKKADKSNRKKTEANIEKDETIIAINPPENKQEKNDDESYIIL